MSFGSFYKNLVQSETDAKTFRVFERKSADGEYYTAHGDNALWVADTFFRTRDVIKHMGADKLAGCTISALKIVTIAKYILVENKSEFQNMEVYGREEGNSEWKITKKASLGNLSEFDSWLFEGGNNAMKEATCTMALKFDSKGSERIVGVAFIDKALRTMHVCEFIDSDRFSNLESVVVQRGAKECVIGVDKNNRSADTQKILAMLERVGVPVTEKKTAIFRAGDIEQDLARLVGSIEQHIGKFEKKRAMASLAALIVNLELLRDEDAFGAFKLHSFDLSQFMKLDKAAVEALNLFPQATDSDKNMCLFGLLNKGRTAAGARLLKQWLQQPLLDQKAIARRLDMVELFVNDTNLRQALQEQHLRRVPDLDRMAKKFQTGKASLQTVVEFYKFCVCLPGLLAALKDHEGPLSSRLRAEYTAVLEELQTDLGQFEAMVEHTVDLDAVEKHEYLINPAFDPQLEELASQKREVEGRIARLIAKTAAELGMSEKQVKHNYSEPLGDHFRIMRKDEKVLRKKTSKHFINLETRKDGVRFTSPKMKQLSEQHQELKAEYADVQAAIVAKALEITESYTPVMEKMNEVIAQLDVIVGFAHVAVNAPTPYCRPEVLPMGSGKIELIASRHPCVEMMDGVEFIPNDLVLVKGESNVQVITGPNMGGKSTYIRQAGVISLLAQIGCFVPCEKASLTIVDHILARVGAGDSQLKGVSTFMKEMLEASEILSSSTENSLIIIDELGRGTSTYDGFGLAWAISENIASKISAFAVFATHFHELTALANISKNVVNKHVTALTSEGNITMLYNVKDGACDRSFGIYVSELANFPKEVVQMAKRKAQELENFGSSAGVDLLSLAQESATPDAKRVKVNGMGTKRVEVSDGSDMDTSEKLLKAFAALPIQTMSDDEVKSKMKELRNEFTVHFDAAGVSV